jgi:hypothetical protein
MRQFIEGATIPALNGRPAPHGTVPRRFYVRTLIE